MVPDNFSRLLTLLTRWFHVNGYLFLRLCRFADVWDAEVECILGLLLFFELHLHALKGNEKNNSGSLIGISVSVTLP